MPAQLAGLGANSESDGLAGPHPGSESESETTNRPETPRDLVTGASPWPSKQRSRQAVPGKASTQPGSCQCHESVTVRDHRVTRSMPRQRRRSPTLTFATTSSRLAQMDKRRIQHPPFCPRSFQVDPADWQAGAAAWIKTAPRTEREAASCFCPITPVESFLVAKVSIGGEGNISASIGHAM